MYVAVYSDLIYEQRYNLCYSYCSRWGIRHH